MSTQLINSQTLYFRPISNIPEYRIRDLCTKMAANGHFKNAAAARLYLLTIWQSNPQLYKAILRQYFEATDFHPKVMQWRDPNRYYSNGNNLYGDDPHMYWRAGDF